MMSKTDTGGCAYKYAVAMVAEERRRKESPESKTPERIWVKIDSGMRSGLNGPYLHRSGAWGTDKEDGDTVYLLSTPARENAEELVKENQELRKMLCIARTDGRAYLDDGELQDNRVHPFIDYKRDSVKIIREKIHERIMAIPEIQTYLATISQAKNPPREQEKK